LPLLFPFVAWFIAGALGVLLAPLSPGLGAAGETLLATAGWPCAAVGVTPLPIVGGTPCPGVGVTPFPIVGGMPCPGVGLTPLPIVGGTLGDGVAVGPFVVATGRPYWAELAAFAPLRVGPLFDAAAGGTLGVLLAFVPSVTAAVVAKGIPLTALGSFGCKFRIE
jgi:hypothetical protein